METKDLFDHYQQLASKAGEAFSKVEKEYPSCVKCRVHCSDCCHAVFGVFAIEAVSLKGKFDALPRKVRRQVLLKADSADRELKKVEIRMRMSEDDPQMKAMVLAKARVACPLLSESQECILYPHRPITCRVYGIPTAIQGKGHVCGKGAFEKGKKYPTFDLDAVYGALYNLSLEYMKRTGNQDSEAASLLLSVSRVIRDPVKETEAGAEKKKQA
jgi:Fe-S-cluster containining protein